MGALTKNVQSRSQVIGGGVTSPTFKFWDLRISVTAEARDCWTSSVCCAFNAASANLLWPLVFIHCMVIYNYL